MYLMQKRLIIDAMSRFNLTLAQKSGLNKREISVLKKLNSPQKIQDFISGLPANLEKNGETLMSPRLIIKKKACHCIEGALFAALALWLHGYQPLIVDMRAKRYDFDHVIAVFKHGDFWGAISKTNHAITRFRDPIYRDLRELLMSYFHEFYMWNTGIKTLVSYSKPFNLKSLRDNSWVTSLKPLWHIGKKLDKIPHHPFILNKKVSLRPADKFERKITKATEYR